MPVCMAGLVGGLMLSFLFHLLAAVSLHSFFRLWNLPSQAFCADCGCEFFEKRSREFVGLIHFEIALCVQWFYQPIFLLYNCELCKRLSHSLQLHSTRTLFSSLSRFRIVRFFFIFANLPFVHNWTFGLPFSHRVLFGLSITIVASSFFSN